MAVLLSAPIYHSPTAARPPDARDVCAESTGVPKGFVRYERPAGHFSVALPRLPNRAAQADQESATKVVVYEGGAVYTAYRLAAFSVEAPASTTEWALDTMRDGAVSGGK